VIRRSLVLATGGPPSGVGINLDHVDGTDIEQTVVVGPFLTGLKSKNVDALTLDNDSILGGGLNADHTALCARNDAFSALGLAQISLAPCGGAAAGVASSHNASIGPCLGNSCADLCGAPSGGPGPGHDGAAGALCDTSAPAPAFEGDGSCPNAASGLVDVGADLGFAFIGAAADLGGRERGATQTYGGAPASCP
jgi:hypothetical protein